MDEEEILESVYELEDELFRKEEEEENRQPPSKLVRAIKAISIVSILGASLYGVVYGAIRLAEWGERADERNRKTFEEWQDSRGIYSDEKLKLYREVLFMADTNKDGRTSHAEWTEVYKIVGFHYSDATSNPQTLSKDCLRKYLGEMESKDE